jgi:hypothetical protein
MRQGLITCWFIVGGYSGGLLYNSFQRGVRGEIALFSFIALVSFTFILFNYNLYIKEKNDSTTKP